MIENCKPSARAKIQVDNYIGRGKQQILKPCLWQRLGCSDEIWQRSLKIYELLNYANAML